MPIRINLLAEAQAAAELRRKDPVKRAIWIGSFLVFAMVLWIAKLQLDIYFEGKNFNNVETKWKNQTAQYAVVTKEKADSRDVKFKLDQLECLHTNRFLWAPVLNALQKTVIDQVQITKLQGAQTYIQDAAHDVGTPPSRVHIPGAMVEKITLVIEAKDLKPSEQNSTKFKEMLSGFDFFVKHLQRRDGFVMEGQMGPLTADPVDPNKQFVTFPLTAHFPEVRRSE